METIPKTLLINSLESMPDDLVVEHVIEKITLLSKLERSRRQIDNGEFYTNDQVKESFSK